MSPPEAGRDAALRRPRTAIHLANTHARTAQRAPSLPRNPAELMSNVPSGQVAAFPPLTLEMRRVLVGLRSKTSLNRYQVQLTTAGRLWERGENTLSTTQSSLPL